MQKIVKRQKIGRRSHGRAYKQVRTMSLKTLLGTYQPRDTAKIERLAQRPCTDQE